MDASVVIAIIGCIEGIGVALIAGMLARSNRRADEYRARREARDQEARKATKASYDLLFALSDAVDVLLRRAHGDNLNGEVDEARCELSEAKDELNDICNEQIARLRS